MFIGTSANPGFELHARDAAQDAAHQAYKSTVELWTLYSIGVAVTMLRTYARVRAVGWKHLRWDDYLIWVGIIFYTAQTALAHTVGSVAHGLANSSMTAAQRAALSLDNPEYQARVLGSKIQIAGWTTYSAMIASIKLSMLAFYVRLMEGLGRSYRIPIYVGFALVIGMHLAAIITIFAACRPFYKSWQINPNPGTTCQPAISRPIVWVSFAANIVTDIYLIFIPIPMLWKSSLKVLKKIATTFILSAGVFVLVCAAIKSILLLVDPANGASLANQWGTRETFVAVITTNLPMIFHLLRTWLARVYGGAFQRSSQSPYKSPSGGFRSIGGGGDYSSRNRRGPPSVNPITANMTFSESEERMVDEMKMQGLKAYPDSSTPNESPNGIVVSNQIEVTHETRSSRASQQAEHGAHETW
ncbi:hypothetical protein NUU61_005999 [Penicillium alfredii]|uniref:Rhodopsin domain-containing protein n=1 Tax=Penicillium alfredii TaxID=1506179 RepID=A0A9W9F001_9EURO|nr:uncharacterized protein NUU61_005999 [Penicillium alfredii]KAJ5091129.1 hypothetical protein NUU61_005999 [Penicillium alfredii]